MLNPRAILVCQREKFVETHPGLLYVWIVVSDSYWRYIGRKIIDARSAKCRQPNT